LQNKFAGIGKKSYLCNVFFNRNLPIVREILFLHKNLEAVIGRGKNGVLRVLIKKQISFRYVEKKSYFCFLAQGVLVAIIN